MALTQRGVNGSNPLFLRPNLGDSVTTPATIPRGVAAKTGQIKNADAGGMAIASDGRVVFVSRCSDRLVAGKACLRPGGEGMAPVILGRRRLALLPAALQALKLFL
jgi:hypothetical protein